MGDCEHFDGEGFCYYYNDRRTKDFCENECEHNCGGERDIDHEYTKEIVCPYCGLEFQDSWEYSKNDEDLGLIECDECGKSFYAHRDIDITYVTEKANYGTCKQCNAEDVVIEDYHSSVGSYNGLCVACGAKEKARLYTEYAISIQKKARER